MIRKKGTELGKPSLTPSRQVGMRDEPSYKETKSKEVGRVADDAVVSKMFRESGKEKRASAEFRHSKNGRGVYYPVKD